ncbi:MAG: SpoIID/LytB domain-containing protein [Bacillota bacterium]|nr:SpoIID/LytB domain-containing protein [Bacillota bacterium]
MKFKYFFITAAVLLVMLWGSGSVFAYDNYENPIRVQIGTSVHTVKVDYGNYQVLDNSGKVIQSMGQGKTVDLSAGQRLSSINGYGRFSYEGKSYRGDAYWINGSMVNILSVEQYLYSVVMKEIGGYAPSLESLKAQTVASRSYACNKMKSPRSKDYDIYSGDRDQAYGGYSDEQYSTASNSVSARVRDAVNNTKGLVLYYNGSLTNAVYCANTGGHTESASVVWGGNYPYMIGVSSPWDGQSFVADYGTYKTLKTPTNYFWNKTMTFSQAALKVESYTGKTIGTLNDIKLKHDGTSDYVTQVTFIGSGGSVSLSGEKVRTALSLYSGSFDAIIGVSLGAYQSFADRLLEGKDFTSLLNPAGQYVTFVGHGYGHCVGMSQWGACVMGYQGKAYNDILDYYYNQGKGDGALTIEKYH